MRCVIQTAENAENGEREEETGRQEAGYRLFRRMENGKPVRRCHSERLLRAFCVSNEACPERSRSESLPLSTQRTLRNEGDGKTGVRRQAGTEERTVESGKAVSFPSRFANWRQPKIRIQNEFFLKHLQQSVNNIYIVPTGLLTICCCLL